MKISFTSRGWDDYLHWQANDRKLLKRINDLIKESLRSPHEGTGKPEPLRHAFSGYWSRRIDDEHRLIYRVDSEGITIVQARFHY